MKLSVREMSASVRARLAMYRAGRSGTVVPLEWPAGPAGARLPRDEDGYVLAFAASDKDGIRAFFEQFGVVVVRDVLSAKQVQRSVDEIWAHDHLNLKNRDKSRLKSRVDPAEWENSEWPTAAGVADRGWISHWPDLLLRESWRNRQNPRVYSAFATVLGRHDLWVTHDRYGIMRPTKDIPVPKTSELWGGQSEEQVIQRPEWATNPAWLHWDQNLFKVPGFQGVQGLVTLSDHRDDNGGFLCIPGFHKRAAAWAREHAADAESVQTHLGVPLMLSHADPIYGEAEKVTMRPGSLVIWDSRICHSNYPNASAEFRYVQYISFLPAGESVAEREQRLALFENEELMAKAPTADGPSSASPDDVCDEMRELQQLADASTRPTSRYFVPDGLSELGEYIGGWKAWNT